ncbi:MAG: VIT1/CCC1 family protein [Armatimonadetes bacterium]|nr:VIT1/CCC1 family protein [Armatimonadota bacterium]MDW8028470.1 VIT1/CCC1 family protein [Armatimonadota bacterium]
MVLNKTDLEMIRSFCIDEFTDYLIYRHLSEREKRNDFKKLLNQMAQHELKHYQFWKSVLGYELKVSVPRWKLALITLSRILLGLTFTIKFLERHEEKVIDSYRQFLYKLKPDDAARLKEILSDEELHEKSLISELNESIVRYIGFIALGLADAVIEITGVHAGFLGATTTTLFAGVAGLIVGLSAAISMAAAAYIQAKHEGVKNPIPSAAATGIAYLFAVVLLAAPYFFTHSNILAFVVSIVLAFALVMAFTFYSSIINESDFKREALESTLVLFATAALSYVFGELLGRIFGLQGKLHLG